MEIRLRGKSNNSHSDEDIMPLTKQHRYNSQQRAQLLVCTIFLFGAVTTTVLSFIWKNQGGEAKILTAQKVVECVASVDDPSDPKSQFNTAYNESFGFFDDITNRSWNLMKERVRNRQNHKKPLKSWTTSVKPSQWYQDNVSFLFIKLLHTIEQMH